MRAIWTGSISFGLVSIPVKVYSGSEHNAGVDLHMLHKDDLSPIRFARICRADGTEVPYQDIVKGYEYADGDYIVLDDKDFDKVNSGRSQAIDIVEFVDQEEIDVRYFEKPYYMEPQKGADKPYALLREALAKSGKVAVAKFVMREREHLAVVKAVGRALVLDQIRYPDEVRQPSQLSLPDKSAADQGEVKMALALINQLTGPFAPEDFHDTYTEGLREMIEEKAKGKPVQSRGQKPRPAKVNDLMAALKASLAENEDVKPKTKSQPKPKSKSKTAKQ